MSWRGLPKDKDGRTIDWGGDELAYAIAAYGQPVLPVPVRDADVDANAVKAGTPTPNATRDVK